MYASKQLAGKPQWLTTESYGLVIILISSCIYSVMGCFLQLAAKTGIPATELVFIRSTFQGTFVVLAMLFYREENNAPAITTTNDTTTENEEFTRDQHQPFHARRLIQVPMGSNATVRSVVFVRGIVGGLGFVLYFYTISVLPLGDAIALLSLHPVATVFAAAAIFKEPIRLLHVIASCLTVVGSFLIAKPVFLFGEDEQEHPENYDPFGYVTAALGTISGAGVFILMRKAGDVGAHTLQLLFSWVCFGVLFSTLLGVSVPLGQGSWAVPSSKLAWLYTFGCCAFGSIGHFLLNFAARHSNPGLASIVRSSGIMWAYILQIWFFHQIPTLVTCIGVLLVSSSLIMVSIHKYYDGTRLKEDSTECSLSDDDAAVEEQELVRPQQNGAPDGDDIGSLEVQPLTFGRL